MSNYEKGDKFVIELGDVYEKTTNGTTEKLYTIKPFNGLAFNEFGLAHLHRVEDYQATIQRKDEEIERLKDEVDRIRLDGYQEGYADAMRASDFFTPEVYGVTERYQEETVDEVGGVDETSIIALYAHEEDAEAHAKALTEVKEIEGDTQYEYTVESWAVKRSLKEDDD